MRSAAIAVETREMPRPPSDSVQIAIRVPKAWLAQADRVAAQISRPGFQASRTDGFRAAVARGFEAFEAEASGEDLDEMVAAEIIPPSEPSRPRTAKSKTKPRGAR